MDNRQAHLPHKIAKKTNYSTRTCSESWMKMIPVPDIMQSDSLPPADESLAPHMRTTALLWCWWRWCFFHRHAASFDLVLKRFSNSCRNRPRLLQSGGLVRCAEQTTPDWLRSTVSSVFRVWGLELGGRGRGEKKKKHRTWHEDIGQFETLENLDIILVTDSWTINTSKYNNVII